VPNLARRNTYVTMHYYDTRDISKLPSIFYQGFFTQGNRGPSGAAPANTTAAVLILGQS